MLEHRDSPGSSSCAAWPDCGPNVTADDLGRVCVLDRTLSRNLGLSRRFVVWRRPTSRPVARPFTQEIAGSNPAGGTGGSAVIAALSRSPAVPGGRARLRWNRFWKPLCAQPPFPRCCSGIRGARRARRAHQRGAGGGVNPPRPAEKGADGHLTPAVASLGMICSLPWYLARLGRWRSSALKLVPLVW